MAKKFSRIDISEKDVFGGIASSAESAEAKIIVLKTALEGINEIIKKNKKDAESLKGSWGGIDPTTIKSQKEFNKVASETGKIVTNNQKAIASRTKVTQALTVEEAKLKEQLRLANLESRQVAKLNLAQEGSVEKLRAKLAILTREWDKLSKAERESTKRGQRLKEGIDQTRISVTKLEQATGRHQRNVGNYATALEGLQGKFRSLTGFVSQLGVALGGAMLVRSSIDVLTEFDEKLADIAKTTGLTTEAARDLSIELFEIDTRTSITNLQQLLSAAGRLGIEGRDNLLAFTEAADKVFVALGDDLDGTAEEIATNLGKIASVFGLEEEFGIGVAIEKVGSGINELSANSKASGGAIQDFTNRMAGLASVLELSDVQSLGAFFDESGQSIEVAASTLTKLLPDLSANYQKFAKVAGMTPEAFKAIAEESPIEALKAVAVGAKSNEKGLFALTETLESYGVESARASGIVGVLTDNVGRLTELQEINKKAIEENTSITDEFNTKNDTLAATWDKMTKRLQQWIVESDTANGITDKLKSTLAFLATNIDTIVTTMGTLVKLFVVYKARLIALNLANKAFGDGTKDMNLSLKNLQENLSGSEGGLKKLGSALKGIGWTAIIALAYEFGTEIYRIASGAALAEYRINKLNKAMSQGSEQGQKIITENNKNLQKEINLINLSTKSEAEKEKLRKQATIESKKRLELGISNLKILQQEADAQRKQAIAERDRLKNKGTSVGGFISGSDFEALQKQESVVTALTAKEKELRFAIVALRDEVTGLDQDVIDLTVSERANTSAKEKSIKVNEVEIDLLKERQKVQEELEQSDFNKTEELIERERVLNIAEYLRIQKEIELSKAKQIGDTEAVKRIEEELIQLRTNEIEARKQIDLAGAESPAERLKIEKQAELDILNLYNNELADANADLDKRNFEEAKKWLELEEELFTKNIDKKLDLLDKELEGYRSQSDELRRLAEDGNITASESIAEQERLEAEALLKKEKLEKRKQQIQMTTAFIQSYLNALEEGKKGGEALATAASDKAVISSFIDSLPAFLEGTEDTGKVSNALDSNGGRLAVLHDNERVFTKEQNQAIGSLTNEEAVNLIRQSKMQNMAGNIAPVGWENASMVAEFSGLKQEMKSVRKAIEDKPVVDWQIERITSEVLRLSKKVTKGSTVVYNRYRQE